MPRVRDEEWEGEYYDERKARGRSYAEDWIRMIREEVELCELAIEAQEREDAALLELRIMHEEEQG